MRSLRNADPSIAFNGIKVFSATMLAQREQLGDTVTAWIASRRDLQIRDIVVTQSSDAQFHCVSAVVFFWQTPARPETSLEPAH
jgi:hypothetical protein